MKEAAQKMWGWWFSRFVTLRGRLNRSAFMRDFALITIGAYLLQSLLFGLLYFSAQAPEGSAVAVLLVVGLIVFWGQISLIVRRLHDVNRHGAWVALLAPPLWILILFVEGSAPFYAAAPFLLILLGAALFLCAAPGTRGD